MKKNFWILMLVLALSVSVLSSCVKECNHTFSDEWYSDAEYHWHPATCEHTEEHKDFGTHVDEEGDGICDVCSLEVGHDHTFASEWSIDDTHHWKQATCTHTNQKKDNELHADEDLDTKCDTCGHHVHDVNAAGYCKHSNCGEKVKDVDENDLEALVNAFLVQSGYVNGGSLVYEKGSPSQESNYYSSYASQEGIFKYGNNFAYYKNSFKNTSYDKSNQIVEISEIRELWHEADGAETFGVESIDGGAISFIASDPNKLIGWYYNLSGLVSGDGAENFLFDIFTVSQGSNATDHIINFNPDGNSVSFSFNVLVVGETNIVYSEGDDSTVGEVVYNVNYYEVSVEFSYTDDMVLTQLDVALDRYTNDAGALENGQQNLKDVDIEYDPTTGEFKFVRYNEKTEDFEDAESATPDSYSYSITQTIGDRDFENEHTKTGYIPESFDLYLTINEDGTLSDKYNGEPIKLGLSKVCEIYVGNCMPAQTSLQAISDLVNGSIKVYRDGVEVEDPTYYANPVAVAMLTYAGDQSKFFFIAKKDGIYTLEISLSGVNFYTLKFKVGAASNEDDVVLEDNQFGVRVTEAHEWSNEYKFTAEESGKYYFNLPSGVGVIDADAYDLAVKTEDPTLYPDPYFDYHNAQIVNGSYMPGSFSLELEAGQTVRFYISAPEKGYYVITYFV